MRAKAAGFTLLEVLIALLVVSVGLMSMVQATQSSAKVVEVMRDQSVAYHVADQVLMDMYQDTQSLSNNLSGQVLMADIRWYWRVRVEPTANQRINRVQVSVSNDISFDRVMAQLTGYQSR